MASGQKQVATNIGILQSISIPPFSRYKEYSALVESAAKKNGKKLSSELELELRNGESSGETSGTMRVGPYQVPGVVEGAEDGGAEENPVKEAELGLKDLFSKELWLITTVLWLAWPIGELSYLQKTILNQRKCIRGFPLSSRLTICYYYQKFHYNHKLTCFHKFHKFHSYQSVRMSHELQAQ